MNLTRRLLIKPLCDSSLVSVGTGDSVRFKIEAEGEAPLGDGTNFCHGFVRVLSD